jgi:hypothetical protein
MSEPTRPRGGVPVKARRRGRSGATRRKPATPKRAGGGRLRIGDSWNAISIIALSQNNPLKAIAEFIENSIDARAQNITVVRGRERGELYLKVIDDGEGIPLDAQGQPDFRYVATHVCDSIKQRLKREGVQGIQGEFGIGLLSFWTVGERLTLASSGADGRTYQMEMRKSEPGYTIVQKRILFSHPGVELVVHPLLPGLRQLSGEKIQSYLAAELRDRIRKSGVRILIRDRQSRKELEVQPRQFKGRLIHELGSLSAPRGEVQVELYLNDPSPDNRVSLFRAGTRVLPSLSALEPFDRPPWNSGYFQGMIDAPFLQLTPGTRDGVVRDESFHSLCLALEPLEGRLNEIVEAQRRAEEEEASRNVLRSVQRALREAFQDLPPEEYDWFNLYVPGHRPGRPPAAGGTVAEQSAPEGSEGLAPETVAGAHVPTQGDAAEAQATGEREFYEFPGPLYSARVSPASAIVAVGTQRSFRCLARDKQRRAVEEGLSFRWRLKEGEGSLDDPEREMVTFSAPSEPGLTILEATAVQGEQSCSAEAVITVTDSLLPKEAKGEGSLPAKGLPGYTFRRAPGELWRSRYDAGNNLVIINNGHRDYLFAAQKNSRKLKYICRLFAKELVLDNFPGFETRELLERMIELGLYTEEHLK